MADSTLISRLYWAAMNADAAFAEALYRAYGTKAVEMRYATNGWPGHPEVASAWYACQQAMAEYAATFAHHQQDADLVAHEPALSVEGD